MGSEEEVIVKVYDITITRDNGKPTTEEMIDLMKQHAKHWGFALQKGVKAQKEHWQCRMSLNRKARPSTVINALTNILKIPKENIYAEPTEGNDNRDWRKPAFYAYIEDASTLVEEERVWTDRDLAVESKYANQISWYPWQQEVIDMQAKEREIIVIHDPIGGTGKSELARRLSYNSQALYLRAMAEYKDVLRAVYDSQMNGKLRNTIILDIPRAMQTEKLRGMIMACEAIKDGHIYDERYEYKNIEIPEQKVIIMCNDIPNPKWLTPDRWECYQISSDRKLINRDINEIWDEQEMKRRKEGLEKERTRRGYLGKQHNNQNTSGTMRKCAGTSLSNKRVDGQVEIENTYQKLISKEDTQ